MEKALPVNIPVTFCVLFLVLFNFQASVIAQEISGYQIAPKAIEESVNALVTTSVDFSGKKELI